MINLFNAVPTLMGIDIYNLGFAPKCMSAKTA